MFLNLPFIQSGSKAISGCDRGNTDNLTLRVIWQYFTFDLFPSYPKLFHLVYALVKRYQELLSLCVFFSSTIRASFGGGR